MPTVDHAANAAKARTDSLARELLKPDRSKALWIVRKVVAHLIKTPGPFKIAITGGAGSGKSSISKVLAEVLDVKVFDFDEYVPGGHTKDKAVYKKRLLDGMNNLWDDLPAKDGWVIEHVEAGNELMLKVFKPTFLLLMTPAPQHLLRVAEARGQASEEKEHEVYARQTRAMESSETAKKQFEAAPGRVIAKGEGWTLKQSL